MLRVGWAKAHGALLQRGQNRAGAVPTRNKHGRAILPTLQVRQTRTMSTRQ